MNIQNPYLLLGTQLKTALDSIIANLPLSPTFENLNDALFNAFFANNPPNNPLTIIYVKSILPNVYNGYVNTGTGGEGREAGLTHYNEKQKVVINALLSALRTATPESIPQLLASADETIATSGLSIVEQTPLFVATTAGKAVNEYWLLNIPQPSAWAAYMVNPNITPQAMDAVNYANVNIWVSAAMQGALLGWGSVDLPKIDFVDMTAASLGAVGIAAGKVVFKW